MTSSVHVIYKLVSVLRLEIELKITRATCSALLDSDSTRTKPFETTTVGIGSVSTTRCVVFSNLILAFTQS